MKKIHHGITAFSLVLLVCLAAHAEDMAPQAAPAAAAVPMPPAQPAASDDEDEENDETLICEQSSRTGSNIKKIRCLSRGERDRLTRETQESVDRSGAISGRVDGR